MKGCVSFSFFFWLAAAARTRTTWTPEPSGGRQERLLLQRGARSRSRGLHALLAGRRGGLDHVASGDGRNGDQDDHGSPRDIVGDSTTLFWSNYQTGGIASATLPNGSSPNRIYKVGLSGGASMAAPEHSAVFEILTDATNLYWIAGDMIKGASLKKIPKP